MPELQNMNIQAGTYIYIGTHTQSHKAQRSHDTKTLADKEAGRTLTPAT